TAHLLITRTLLPRKRNPAPGFGSAARTLASNGGGAQPPSFSAAGREPGAPERFGGKPRGSFPGIRPASRTPRFAPRPPSRHSKSVRHAPSAPCPRRPRPDRRPGGRCAARREPAGAWKERLGPCRVERASPQGGIGG